MRVCDSSSFSEEHNFKNCCCCPDSINLARKWSSKRCGCSPEGSGKVLQVCLVEQFFFITFLFECWKENDRNQLCCSLICKEKLSEGLVWCEVVTHSCSSLSTELRQRGTQLLGAGSSTHPTVPCAGPVCEGISSQQSPSSIRALAVLQHQPPACVQPPHSCEGESLPGAGVGGKGAGYPEWECMQGEKTIAGTSF